MPSLSAATKAAVALNCHEYAKNCLAAAQLGRAFAKLSDWTVIRGGDKSLYLRSIALNEKMRKALNIRASPPNAALGHAGVSLADRRRAVAWFSELAATRLAAVAGVAVAAAQTCDCCGAGNGVIKSRTYGTIANGNRNRKFTCTECHGTGRACGRFYKVKGVLGDEHMRLQMEARDAAAQHAEAKHAEAQNAVANPDAATEASRVENLSRNMQALLSKQDSMEAKMAALEAQNAALLRMVSQMAGRFGITA